MPAGGAGADSGAGTGGGLVGGTGGVGGTGDSGKEQGSEGGPCYGNGTCNAGLSCLSNLCVNAGGGGTAGEAGTGGIGGSPGDASTQHDADSGGSAGVDATAEAEADANPACIPGVVEAVQWSSSVVLYVVDRSGSMNCNSPPVQTTLECTASPKKKDVAQPSKWELSRDALLSALTNLESTTPLPSAGLMLFANNDSCGAPTAASPGLGPLSSSQHDSFALALNAVVPKGDSPVVMTTVSAYQLLHATTGSGNKYVVLLTDSGESCLGSTDFLVQKAAEAHALGIRTFVLGAPGSEVARGFLSRVAFAGGTASSSLCDHTSIDSAVGDCHLDMTQPGLVFADELAKALQRTGDAAKSCEFEVPLTDGGKADPNKVNVTYKPLSGAGSVIPKDEVHPCNTGNLGWQYTDSTSTKIRICGPQCEAIRTDPAAEVSVEIGCATVVAM